MEDTDKIEKKGNMIQILFLILLAVAIVALIVTTITLIKNKDIIAKDPLSYGMEVHDFQSCNCIDSEGKIWNSVDGGFTAETRNYNFNDSSEMELIFEEWDKKRS